MQCTANGYGERTGNADLFAVVGNLEMKLDMRVLPEGKLHELVRVSHAIADIANLPPNTHQAYVGVSAFAHKAGLHASALKVNQDLYNHMDPELVGNDMRVLVTEMAGRASVELKGRELGFEHLEPEVRHIGKLNGVVVARPDRLTEIGAHLGRVDLEGRIHSLSVYAPIRTK